MQRLKDCGVQTVYFTGSPEPNFENMLDAAKQLDFSPIYVTERNFYEAVVRRCGTRAATRTTST